MQGYLSFIDTGARVVKIPSANKEKENHLGDDCSWLNHVYTVDPESTHPTAPWSALMRKKQLHNSKLTPGTVFGRVN